MKQLMDQAIGSYEAACVMGVHFTRPERMARKGLLRTKILKSPVRKDPSRIFRVYSFVECDRDWLEYERERDLNGGKTKRRPRGFEHLRQPMLDRLTSLQVKIDFTDVVSVGDAAEILGIHWTFPPRMADQGKLVGRTLINGRNQRGRCWILSMSSIERNHAVTKHLQDLGIKKGKARKESPLDKQLAALRKVEKKYKEGRERISPASRSLERSHSAVKLKKRMVFLQTGFLRCEVCKFDFEHVYGQRGQFFAEAHHIVGHKISGEREVGEGDFAILCANCHRMIHRRPEMTVDELRKLVEHVKNMAR